MRVVGYGRCVVGSVGEQYRVRGTVEPARPMERVRSRMCQHAITFSRGVSSIFRSYGGYERRIEGHCRSRRIVIGVRYEGWPCPVEPARREGLVLSHPTPALAAGSNLLIPFMYPAIASTPFFVDIRNLVSLEFRPSPSSFSLLTSRYSGHSNIT